MKRLIATALSATVILSLCGILSGCGKERTSGTGMDVLKDKVIRVASWGNVKPQAGTEVGDLKLEQIAAAEKKYGCKVEYLTITDLTQQLLTAATTGQVVAEVCMHRSHRVKELLMQGDYFYSLEELGGDSKSDLYNPNTISHTTYNGKTYGFWYDPSYVQYVMVFNKSMLQRNGIDLPYSLVQNRKWTFDAWFNIMKRTTDPANNIYGCGTAGIFPTIMMYANNTSLYAFNDNLHKQNTGDKRLLETFEFLTACATKDKVIEFNIGVSKDYNFKEFMKGRYATIITEFYVVRDFLKDGMSDEYGLLPIPIGPSATEYRNADVEVKTFCIQKAVPEEEAKALLQFMNEAFAYPLDRTDDVRSYYESIAPDEESLETLMLLQELPIEMYEEYTGPDLRSKGATILDALLAMAAGNKPIKSTLDSHANEIQAILDEYYKQ